MQIIIISIYSVFNVFFSTEQQYNIPWYVSIPVSENKIYNASDTLKKYIDLNEKFKNESAKYFSFMSDLHYMLDSVDTARIFLKKAYEADSLNFCKNYTGQIYRYVTHTNPERKTYIPEIVEKDFENFINITLQCDCKHRRERIRNKISNDEEHKLYLKLERISIYDQWYRIPTRVFQKEKQLIYDTYCQEYLDSVFFDKNVMKLPGARVMLNVIILHAEDCNWSLKWIKKYYKESKDYRLIEHQLHHYLYRSVCRDNNIVKKEIKKMLDDL